MKFFERLNALLRSLTSGGTETPAPARYHPASVDLDAAGTAPADPASVVPDLLTHILSSFEAARDYLTIRLHNQDLRSGIPDGTDTCLFDAPMPELRLALALDLPGQFRLLRQCETQAWGLDDDELIWTAQCNLSDRQQSVHVRREEIEGFTLVTLTEPDYAAVFAADFDNHCSRWMGKMGAMVGFPTMGTVLISPLDDAASFNKAFTQMAERTNRVYREGPSPLSNNLYWFHTHRYELFPKSMLARTLTYAIPNRLLAYLRTPLSHPRQQAEIRDAVLQGTWEGFYEYGQGYERPLAGSRVGFQMTLFSRKGQLEGTCTDEGRPGSAGVWGFVDRELISFIRKYAPSADEDAGNGNGDLSEVSTDVHFTGFFDRDELSFTGTWVIDSGDGKVNSGSWAMVKI